MKKLYKLLLICLLTIAGGGNALKAQDKAYETPTLVNGYYEISKADHLFWFAATVNSGTAPINAVLTNDINLGNTSWTPIGSLANPYSGHFDGQGYTISGLNINGVFSWETTASNGTNAGLFGSINNAGIHNLTVSGSNTATVSTSMESSIVSSGLLVGHMTDAIVYNCFANGTVTSSGYQSVGGLVGTAQHSIIINCGSEAAVTIETTVLSRSIGGLVGHMTAGYDFPLCLLNSWCTGNVTTGEHGNVGGLVGYLADDAVNNYYSGTLSANKDDNVGQLFGYVYNKIRVSPDDEDLTIFTPVIEKNYYKSGTAVGFVEEGMNDTGFVETYSDMEDLRKKMNSNLPLVNAIIDGHRGYLSTTEWAELISLLNGEDVKAFHWYNNGSSLNLHDDTFSANGFCSICGAYEPAKLVDNYYEIYNAGNLFWFAEYINHIDRTASAKLMNDIDLENRPWTPIGTTGETNHNFRGHFDGNGKTITGLNVTVTRNGGGFFGEVRLGTVEDFTIYGEVKLNGKHSYVGGVIGSAPGANSDKPEHNGATIRNITSYVNVTLGEGSHGSNHVAGFIGYANHETLIENCTWYGTLDLDAYRAQDGVGGLVGKILQNSAVTIRNCAAYGTIKTSYQSGSYSDSNNVPFNNIFIGGIVSNSVENAQTTLENCIWAGTLINNTNLGDNAHISAIGTLNGIKSVSNCYALDNMPYITTNKEHNEGITEVTAGQLASGEIAYKLQGTQATQIWGQNIDNGETADSKPILGGAKVYKHTFDVTTLYSNSQTLTAGGKCGDNLYWHVNDENTLTIFGTGAMYYYGSMIFNGAPWRSLNPAPTSLVMEEGITTIGTYAFAYCSGFTGSLTIPNSVTTIGERAFYNCSGFTGSLTIPNSVTTIGDYAFAYCSGFTGSLTIGNSVTSIGNNAFYYCEGFTGSLTIGNSVTTIGYHAFERCSGFTGSLTIPNSVTTIGGDAFAYCSGFTGSLTIGNSVTTIEERAFCYCTGFTGSLTIPNSVTTIGEYAFYDCSGFTGDLTIGNSVTTIENYAFYNCEGFTEVYSLAKTAPTLKIKAFTGTNSNATLYYPVSSEQSYDKNGWFNYFPQHIGFDGKCGDNLYWYVNDDNILTIFGTGAMYDYYYYGSIDNQAPWHSLNPAPTSLVLEEGITTIGNSAFYGCSGFTGSLTIPNSVTTIGNYAFRYCSGFTGSLTIGNSVTSIGEYAFANCYGFTGSLTIPNNVTSIGEYAFTNCYGFTGSLTIPNSVTSIGNSAFYGCSGFTGDLTIPNSVTTIGDNAFADCRGFTGSLTIPNSVTSIGEYAFQYCSGFNGSLTIPNSVTTIGNEAFYDCEGFKEVYSFAETAPTLGTNAFANINENATLYFPASSEQSYDENGWFNYFSKRIGINGICGDYLYWKVSDNVLTIFGTGAMYDYDNIDNKAPWHSLNPAPTSLVLEEGVSHIGDYAFYECSSFTEVYSLAETAPALGTDAFKNINENATLYYPASSEQSYDENGWFNYFPQHIGFDGKCGDNLYWYVDDTNTLTIFGTGAMYDYSSIGSSIGNNTPPWRSLNPAPISLVLEDGITHIGNSAFSGCSSFTGSLTIPNSVTSIGEYAFANCSGFTGSLTIPNSITNIEVGAFGACSGFTGSLTIPNSVTTIGDNAFVGCYSFTGSLTIPNSVTTIGDNAFYICSGFTGSLTIPNSVTTIGDNAFHNCSGFTGDLTIPNSVTTIGDNAFYNCIGFSKVHSFAEVAPTLGTNAFTSANSNATLYYPASSEQSYDDKGWFEYFPKRIGLGKCGDNLFWNVDDTNTLTIFGTGAMYDYEYSGDNISPWRKLETAPTSLVLEEGITHIGNCAFEYCSGFTGSLTIPNSVTAIGDYAFYICSGFTGDLTIPNSVTTIGDNAFHNCSGFTGDLTIPNSVTNIGNYAFYWCSGFTGSLTIPNSVTTIGDYAFVSCYSFTGSLTIPNSVTTIGNSAFESCSGFTGSLTIPNSVTTIGNYAFYWCKGFTGSLTIPNSVTTIGDKVFYYCDGFTEIFFYRDTNPTIGTSAFSDINANAKVYAPVIWESFSNIPEDKLVKMATYVGQQTTDNGQQSSSTGWVGLADGQTWPDEDDHVAINASLVLGSQQDNKTTRQQGRDVTPVASEILKVKSFGLCGNENTTNGSITIEDGGQLYCEVARGEVTVKKEIVGYAETTRLQDNETTSETVWYTIASPLKDTLLISDPQFLNSSVPQFLSSNSDLYRYDEPSYTWQNAKNSANNGFNTIDPGRGYLYANANDTVLEFTGMINTNDVTYSLTTDGERLNGFHLVGNPFTHNITFAHLNTTEGAELVNGYYVLNGEGAWGATLGSNEDDVIKVGQGVLVKAKSEGRLAISRQPSAVSRQRSGKGQQTTDNGQQSLCISVSNAKYSDRAFVVFDKGVGLDKMNHENENIPLLYIPMEDADYAIAMMDINVNEIPVNFETNVMGEYTISLRQENCEFSELYLLDKETDEKVNILEQDYTFIATSSENPERFILMKDNRQQTTDNRPWVYVNNGDIVIYNIEGDADIKIFDALGRCVYQGESSDETTRISNGYSAGVYMIQKVDEKGVNVQKIIL